jgi:uncharacterized protein YndB with AHSA1/START domain
MVDTTKFKPKTVYVTYIAATPQKVWQALTDPVFTRQYFFGFAVDIEPKQGGAFVLRQKDGSAHVSGEVVEWSPPRRLCVSWHVENMKELSELPICLVTYDIEPSGEAVKLSMTESHSWDVPADLLKGGQSGWPKIMSGLKSLLETGQPLTAGMEGPLPEFVAAVKKAVAEKPWLKR